MRAFIPPQFVTWFGFPNLGVALVHYLVYSEKVSASVSMSAPSEANSVLHW